MEKANRYRYLCRILPQVMDVNRAIVALDAGCGEGRMLKHMAGYWPRWRLFGVDVMKENCRSAKQSCPTATVKKDSITNLRFPRNTFDLTVCSDVLEHIWDREHSVAVKHLQRVTKPGGLIVVSTPALHHQEGHMRSLGHVSYLDVGLIRSLFAGCDVVHESQICKVVPQDPTQIVILIKR